MSGWTWRAPKLIDGRRRGGIHALASRGGPAGRLGEHAQHRGLVQPELAIPGRDPEDDLLGVERIAVVERLERHRSVAVVAEHVGEEVLRLVDAAQDAGLAAEDLHRDDRIEALALEDALGAREVDVGRFARQDLA